MRPVLFGNACFKMLKDETGMTAAEVFSRIESMDVTALPDVLCYALRCGELASNKPASNYDALTVAVWLDQSAYTNEDVANWIAEAFAKPKPEDTKKKTASPAT